MKPKFNKPKLIEVKTEEDIDRINYYSLNKVIYKKEANLADSKYLYALEVSRSNNREGLFKFIFYDFKLMKYFISKLSKANFKRERMKIDYN